MSRLGRFDCRGRCVEVSFSFDSSSTVQRRDDEGFSKMDSYFEELTWLDELKIRDENSKILDENFQRWEA